MSSLPNTNPPRNEGKRTPKDVIDDAVNATKRWEELYWWVCVVMASVGGVAVLAGVWRGDAWVGLTGAIPGVLCFYAMRSVNNVIKDKANLRLLEIALNNAKSAEDARKAITQVYGYRFGSSSGGNDHVVSKTGQGPRDS